MCMQTSVYIRGELSASNRSAKRFRQHDLSRTGDPSFVLFCFVKRTSNVGMGTSFKQLAVLQRGCSLFVHQAEDRTWEMFVVHSEQFYLNKRKVVAIMRTGHVTRKAVKAQDEGDRHPEGVGVSRHTSQCGSGMVWVPPWLCGSLHICLLSVSLHYRARDISSGYKQRSA